MEATIIPAIVYLSLAALCIALVVVAYTYFASRKIARTQLEKQQLALSYQEALLRETLLAQERERKRFAQDIHDEISGKMNVINLQLQLLAANHAAESDTAQRLTRLYEQGRYVGENARRIAHNLLPPTLESFGVVGALTELADQVNQTGAIRLEVQLAEECNQLEQEYQLHFFRIVQELVNNSIRHGGAAAARLHVDYQPGVLICHYEDNGRGFEMGATHQPGLGLQNIRSRIQFMNGVMRLQSAPAQGFQITIELPWKKYE